MHAGPIRCFILCIFLISAVFAESVQPSFVVSSSNVKQPLTNERVARCIQETAEALKLRDRELPQILVLQLSPEDARKLGVANTTVVANRGDGPSPFYELWIVGPNAVGDLTQGVVGVFEKHFGMSHTDSERGGIVLRIMNKLTSTVAVGELKTLR